MLAGIKNVLLARRGLKAFKAVPRKQRSLVFYTETEGYWTYFEPVFRALRSGHLQPVLYVTSSETDPFLHMPPDGLQAFYVGSGSIRTLFFATLDTDVLLMTMPDLQTFHIKRSPYPVKYVYLHHSLVSTHMVYRPEAFDHFDVILCAGPHHITETRAREAIKELPAKELVEHGYGRLDTIMAEGVRGPRKRQAGEQPHVLIAPSWGENGLLERHAIDLIQSLLSGGLRVTVRPHPRTTMLRPDVIHAIFSNFGVHPRFAWDTDANSRRSLYAADVMVSDWSGAAFEFAMGLERPVVFIDVPRKVQNPDYLDVECEPLEIQVREHIGEVISPSELERVVQVVYGMLTTGQLMQDAAIKARLTSVFNPGHSGQVAADYLQSLLT